jgi:hypothetical protein
VYLFHRYWQINQNDKRKSVFSCKSIFSITSWINWIYDPPLSTLLRTQIFYGGMNVKFALPNLTFIFSVILLGLNIVNFLNAEFKFGLTPYACYHFLSLCGLTGSIYSCSFCRFFFLFRAPPVPLLFFLSKINIKTNNKCNMEPLTLNVDIVLIRYKIYSYYNLDQPIVQLNKP